MEMRLTPDQVSGIETFFGGSELKPKLSTLEKGAALLIPKEDWKYKSPPRTLVHELMGAGQFSVMMTKDKKAWLIIRLT